MEPIVYNVKNILLFRRSFVYVNMCLVYVYMICFFFSVT